MSKFATHKTCSFQPVVDVTFTVALFFWIRHGAVVTCSITIPCICLCIYIYIYIFVHQVIAPTVTSTGRSVSQDWIRTCAALNNHDHFLVVRANVLRAQSGMFLQACGGVGHCVDSYYLGRCTGTAIRLQAAGLPLAKCSSNSTPRGDNEPTRF